MTCDRSHSKIRNWMATLGAARGLNSHLVTISGLEAGEIVTLSTRGLQIEVTADEEGEATMTALLGLGLVTRDATIERLSRRPLTGTVREQRN